MREYPPTSSSEPSRAAHYVRMSTEHQQYSTENQLEVLRRYADSHGMDTVRVYADEGKSGLNLAGRTQLQLLLKEVETGNADFTDILVYDVSRWGRFLDADESAFYEYLCKRANIRVHYCAEPFENDGSLPSVVLKSMKRAMAGEYSRELSVKVFAGQCRLIELGFRQGGPAGYGLRRQLLAEDRSPKQILERGQQKSLQTDRVVLVPGPAEEVRIVQEIYGLFIDSGKTQSEIANRLNARNILTDLGHRWTPATVHQILTNPKYIGVNVYNRRSFKLKKKRVANPPDMWIHRDDAFIPIVSRELFARVQAEIEARYHKYSDEEMLDGLRSLLSRCGKLSGILIDESDMMPNSSAYRRRFKSLLRAYQLIGYTPEQDYSYLEQNRLLRIHHHTLLDSILQELTEMGAEVHRDPVSDILTINENYTASLILARCRQTAAGSYRWLVRLDRSLNPDITIAARLMPGNEEVLDYYCLPILDCLEEKIRFAPANGIVLDVYRFEDLTFFKHLAMRRTVEEVA